MSCVSGSIISELCPAPSGSSLKLMQATIATNNSYSHMGERPKDSQLSQYIKSKCSTTKGYLSICDGIRSRAATSTSPGLLQVNNCGDCNSEGNTATICKATLSRTKQL
ncbi:hypothetical protein Pcinc_016145 [Petrolisthes cinctipes]|uniref:Uncharacterized protein n=1 Tax=Petrolisthes cinctipes TaxID=88211 RepID=A0AAE1FU90_PETCI|nr:hypothetical protein Pcinc_016145 [Petrolisthes cinctipes]